MKIYNIVHVQGLEGQKIAVHMCVNTQTGEDMVEFILSGPSIVLSHDQIHQINEWICQEFAKLEKEVVSIQ
jgi:hypothetical protein